MSAETLFQDKHSTQSGTETMQVVINRDQQGEKYLALVAGFSGKLTAELLNNQLIASAGEYLALNYPEHGYAIITVLGTDGAQPDMSLMNSNAAVNFGREVGSKGDLKIVKAATDIFLINEAGKLAEYGTRIMLRLFTQRSLKKVESLEAAWNMIMGIDESASSETE